MGIKSLAICALVLGVSITSTTWAQYQNNGRPQTKRPAAPRRTYVQQTQDSDPIDKQWSSKMGPWDFSGMLGLYNPGFGVEGLAAYRVVDNLIRHVDNSLSVEAGLGFVGVSDTLGGQTVSYSLIEIPIMARWDFRIQNSNFIVGPRAGFNYLAGGGTESVNGVNYNVRGSALYFQLGGFGMYRFNEQWAIRAGINIINYTTLSLGATFFL